MTYPVNNLDIVYQYAEINVAAGINGSTSNDYTEQPCQSGGPRDACGPSRSFWRPAKFFKTNSKYITATVIYKQKRSTT